MEASVTYLTMLCCYVYYVDDSKKQNNDGVQHIQAYTYESGSPVGMNVTTTTGSSSNPTVTTTQYYFIKNLQGDIVAIADATGEIQYTYTYDSWGKVLSTKGQGNSSPSVLDTSCPANINPFRYRGYYYDAENQLYWLQSRFYDPSTGRFLNADSLLDKNSLFGSNLFVYCANNSVCYNDPTGMWCPEANARHEYHDLNYGYINKDQYDLYISVQNQLPCKKGKTVYYGQPRICTDGSDGNKIPDSNWQPYTALSEWGSKTITVLDAYQMPYVVMPGAGSANLGDKAVLINWDTGQCINCIVGEVGSSENGWGEVSIAALWSTGYPNHMTANNASGITGNYEIILYSGVSYDYDWSWGYTKINR